jgi:hypothetical protein
MLRIFHTHPARTSLLQDFAFYEVVSSKKIACCLFLKFFSPAPIYAKDASARSGNVFAISAFPAE